MLDRFFDRTSIGGRPDLDQRLTGKANTLTGKERLLEERDCFLHSSTGKRKSIDRYP